MTYAVVFTLILSGFCSVRAQETPSAAAKPLTEVDALFADYDKPGSPGCALGVIRNGDFIYRRGYGMANLEYAIPISSESVFRIGSTSKQFTAMAIALLAEQGKLSLDDPLSRYFPDFPAWSQQVTLSQLIHHTSGIRDYPTLALLAGKGEDPDYYTTEWVIDMLARQKETNFPPGSQFLYSNSGYLLLAVIVQRVSGMSLKEFSQAQIFGPLGMKQSHFHDDHTHIVPNRASGYAPTRDGYRISMTTLDMVGDGGVFTTIEDLLQWDRNFYANRLGDRGQALIEEITTPGTLTDDQPIDYAFGLFVDDYRGQQMISHGGAFVGFRAELARVPAQQFSAAVLCNRSDGAARALAKKVMDYFLQDVLEPSAETPSEHLHVELSAEQLEVYAGDFWEPSAAFAAETRVVDGKLWAVHSPERRNEMMPLGDDRFLMIGMPTEFIVEFDLSDEGIVEMRGFADGKPRGVFTPFERRRANEAELTEYGAVYYSPELDVDYQIAASGSELLLRIDGGPAYVLTPMFGDTFENPDLGAFVFVRDADGEVAGLTLQSGRVRNLAFQRKS